MKIQEDQIIGELVAQDYRTASVFKKYDIDFCCQGNRTISDACESEQIEESLVISDLNALLDAPSGTTLTLQCKNLTNNMLRILSNIFIQIFQIR